MSGTAISSGAENQAAVAAYIAVRMLLERRLNWAELSDDVPVAIDGEVGGPGDDIRIEFGTRRAPLEAQCKRTLVGRAALASAITDIAEQLTAVPRDHEIVLVVGSGSSTEVRDAFATDVRNFRQGRRDGLRRITRSVLAGVDAADEVLSRLYVVTLDIDVDSGAGTQVALDGLRQALTEPDRAEEAWAILVRFALKLARRGRWDRAGVETLLRSHSFVLRPVGADARWLEQIDYARTLNANWRPRTAAGLLDHLASELHGQTVRADVRRQLHSVRGASAIALGDIQKAREQFGRALEHTVAPVTGGDPPPADQLKGWLDARYNYGLLLHFHGDHSGAESISREILAWNERHVFAWGLLTLALNALGADPESPPADLTDAPEYRDALAQIAAQRGDWRQAVHVLVPVLASGHRGPRRLIQHATSLINLSAELPNSEEKVRILEEAERAANEAIRVLENAELDQQLTTAFFIRGRAREALGRTTDAMVDYERAAVLAPTDVNVVIRAVQARRADGDLEGAVALLTDDAIASSAVLRVIRAEIRADRGARDDALDDLVCALDELPGRATPATFVCFLQTATLALELDNLELARRALAALDVSEIAKDAPKVDVIRGRIACAVGDWVAAEAAYRAAAASAAGEDAAVILGEFATALSVANRNEPAIGIYQEAGADDPLHPAFKNYIGSLMRTGRFGDVVDLVSDLERDAQEGGATAASLPSILLNAAIDIAWRRDDYVVAARLLDARLEQEEEGGKAAPAGLVLSAAGTHQKIGNRQRAADLVDGVLARHDLSPEDRMRAASVLVSLGAYQRAIETAFAAVRAGPSEKQMIASFIGIVLAPAARVASMPVELTGQDGSSETGTGLATDDSTTDDGILDDEDDQDLGSDGRQGVVAANSFVRVQTEDGQSYDYFVYRDPPVDSRLGEYLMTDAAVADLVGKHVGDVVVRNRGTWNEQRLRVKRVMPAVVVVFRRYMRTFAARFPDEASFLVFNVGKDPTLDDFRPLMAVIHAGAARTDEILANYDETPLPLGALAQALRKPLVEVTRALAADPSRRIHTEGPPYTDYTASLEAATTASTLVLTRPALVFLEELGLWETLVARYRLLVPSAMMDEWEEEIRELQATTDGGRIHLREVVGRPAIDTTPVGAAGSVLRASRALFERVRGATTVLHRPVSALTTTDDRWRERLGAPSFDAVALARAERAILYADDLGLRAIARIDFEVKSFSTTALLEALHHDGRISDDTFENATVRLIEWGHDMVPVRGPTVIAAFGLAGTSMRTADRVLDRLADPRITAVSAAVVAVQTLRAFVLANIATTTLDDAATRVAKALIHDRDPSDIIPLYISLVRDGFRLLPREREVIESSTRLVVSDNRIIPVE